MVFFWPTATVGAVGSLAIREDEGEDEVQR